MSLRWTEEELNKYKKRNNKNINPVKKKTSKYKNIKISIDGHTFDSKKEANYYLKLKNDLALGLINCIAVQPKFLLPGEIIYKADFIVIDNKNQARVIDIKGFETEAFKIKKKLFNSYFGVKLEVIK